MHVPLGVWIALSAAAAWCQPGPVSGQYVEDRTMRVYGRPCEWSTDWAHRGREAVLAWNIQSGEYEDTPLAGLRIVSVLVGDFSLTEPSSPRRSAIYLDTSAPPAQRDAGVRWLRSQYTALLGRVVAIRALPITFSSDPDNVVLDVGTILSLRMHRTDLPEEARSWAQPIHDPFIPLVTSTFATTSHVSYTGRDLNIRWTREENAITGYFGTFAGNSPESMTEF
jgi:hypothetical protein